MPFSRAKQAAALSILLSASVGVSANDTQDAYQWLEAVDSDEALNWVYKTNKRTEDNLKGELYQSLYKDALDTLNQESKLSNAFQIGDYFFELKKTEENPRGLLQRTPSQDYLSGTANWSVVIDIDKLSKSEGKPWVYHGLNCYEDKPQQCLLALSPGGTDADEQREFNAISGTFMENGFFLPNAKTDVTWVDENSWMVATEYGEDALTDSGYARKVRFVERDGGLNESRILFAAKKESVSAGAWAVHDGENKEFIVTEGTSFWTRDYYRFNQETAALTKLEIQESAVLLGKMNGQWIISLKQDWTVDEDSFVAGSVVLASDEALKTSTGIKVLFAPTKTEILDSIRVTEAGILLLTLDNVVSKAYWLTSGENLWHREAIDIPENGAITVSSINSKSGDAILRYESFLTPPSLLAFNAKTLSTKTFEAQPATFDATPYMAEQLFATSKDGTKVPYFVIRVKDMQYTGKNPAHIFAYGGFRSSLTPSYSGSYEATNGAYGKLWLDRGGVYVLANIRGGGEYGPKWHSAALKQNRARAFEDMEAVAKDLAKRDISSSNFTSIEGRSNGGLLTGSTMTRRPELYNAVISGVPLLDMKRYHLLLAGASWMGEYGNPDTSDWSFIKSYSPYQNVHKSEKYPPVFFYTSTRDDRVHPAHARKMAALMMAQGHDVEYYENLEGGHGGSVTNEQLAHRIALSYTFLWKQIEK